MRSNALAVWAARRFFCLPYFRSRITFEDDAGTFRFHAERALAAPPVTFDAEYRGVSEPFTAARGSIEEFLAERYCLYAAGPRGELFWADVHHGPWPLQRATGVVSANGLLASHELAVDGEPLLHFSKGVDTVVWPLERVA